MYSLVIAAVLIYFSYQLFRLVTGDADLALLSSTIRKDAFAGKVVWVVGSSYGIGEQLALHFARYGGNVVLSARSLDKLEAVKGKCIEEGKKNGFTTKVHIAPLDVLKFDSHKEIAAEVVKSMGKVDVVVLNAARSQRGIVERTVLSIDKDIFELNVIGTLSMTKAILPHMIERKSGHIVAISSVAGKMGAPVSGSYAATKHALQGFFNTLRYEVADRNITVTTVCPGPVVSMNSELAFSETPGQIYGQHPKLNEGKMATERCAYLTVVGVANKLEELWISNQPILFFVYVSQYFPTLGNFLGKKVGKQRVKQYESGDGNINTGLMSGIWKKDQ